MDEFDFYISSNGRLIIPEYDINYLVNMRESSFPSMPEANDSTARIAGKDGDIVLSTTYEPLSFNIVCYTDDNLTPEEKNEEEQKVNRFLNSIKAKTKTFAFESKEKFYNVKYTGALSIINYPKHLQFSIPLKSSDSYGYSLEKMEILGEGSKKSKTIQEVGAIITIEGPANNPIISLNDIIVEYQSEILENEKIIINTEQSTVIYVDKNGIISNVMKYYNHIFPKIEYGINELKIDSGVEENKVKIIWRDLIL